MGCVMMISLEHIIKTYNLHIKGVLHIGAHHGQEYHSYLQAGVEDMIFFEPIKSTFSILSNTLLDSGNRVSCFNIALGNEVGEKEMYVETVNKGQSCSFLEPGTHLKQYPKITFDKKEVVKINMLDNIPFNREKYNMINIDVQGFELEVFKGAEKTLPYVDIIYSEVNFEEVYKGCVHVRDLDRFLGTFGFIRILTSNKPKSWGDALYLKYCKNDFISNSKL